MERGMPDFDALFGIWEMARDMSPEEIKLALGEIKSLQLPHQSAMFMKAMLVMQWAKKDGASAMQYVSESKDRRDFFPMHEMALQAWGSSDPNGAYRWYEANKETLKPRERKQFEARAIAALAKDHFDQAFLKAKNVDSSSRDEVFQSLGSTVANNPEQRQMLLDYLQTLDDKDALTETGSTIARQIAMKDVQGAIEFVEKWPGEDKSEITGQVAEQWGQTEPEKAMAWRIGQLAADADPADAVEDIFAGWARKTPDQAKNWLNGQSDIDQDQLRSEAIKQMRWDDNYQLSISWADEIKDEKKRLQNYRNIYSSWKRDDKEGAQRWLDAQDPEMRKSIAPGGR
ncbi:MAG: hypothetical protein H7A51_06900 [Akkermansiaceae bacterium]|nr:hypothetical protein [Akkermansiaceae bacterium]